jgi:hypothetical protein
MPDGGLSSSLFTPLVLAGLIYVLLYAIGQAMPEERSSGVLDAAFAVLLLTSAYAVVLLVLAIVQKYVMVGDMLRIVAVMVVFCIVLVVALLAIFDLGVGSISRARAARRRGPSG